MVDLTDSFKFHDSWQGKITNIYWVIYCVPGTILRSFTGVVSVIHHNRLQVGSLIPILQMRKRGHMRIK